MKVHLLWVGRKGKREPESELCQRYITRLESRVRFSEKVLKPFQGGNQSTAEIQQRESARLLEELNDDDYLILCDERGKNLSSKGLAKLFQERERAATRRLVFCIGGAMGVADALRQRANFMLSLSQMTLPHALARVLLVEQIYRAHCINSGHPYHHEG